MFSLNRYDINEINDYVMLLERKLNFYKNAIIVCNSRCENLDNSPYKVKLTHNIQQFKTNVFDITLELELLQDIKNKLQ